MITTQYVTEDGTIFDTLYKAKEYEDSEKLSDEIAKVLESDVQYHDAMDYSDMPKIIIKQWIKLKNVIEQTQLTEKTSKTVVIDHRKDLVQFLFNNVVSSTFWEKDANNVADVIIDYWEVIKKFVEGEKQ